METSRPWHPCSRSLGQSQHPTVWLKSAKGWGRRLSHNPTKADAVEWGPSSRDSDGVVAQTWSYDPWRAGMVSSDSSPDDGAGITGGENQEWRSRQELQVTWTNWGSPGTVPSEPAGPVEEK